VGALVAELFGGFPNPHFKHLSHRHRPHRCPSTVAVAVLIDFLPGMVPGAG
jgi:hypothetical protein